MYQFGDYLHHLTFSVLPADLGPGEQELVNNTLILYDGGNDKSDSDDDDIEDDQKGDDNKELKQEGENEITLGKETLHFRQ